ncbi:hypothetical protein ACFW4O_33200 [Streptomyces mutabilis]|uniref:hypothetical protein n=1 Tax=Streptomyces mutabilis TaxID=67332 RepID=UPI0036A42DD6
MRVVRASLRHSTAWPTARSASVTVEDLLWVHAAPDFGVEHIRARPTASGVDVFLFLRADTDAVALERARDLLVRARGFLVAQGLSATLSTD